MRKFGLTLIAGLALAACSQQGGYTINGHIEGANDGDSIFLQVPNGQYLAKVDGAVIKDGNFSFKGNQDSAVMHYLTYESATNGIYTDFFLENGQITAEINAENPQVTGTPNNDRYQAIKDQVMEVQNEESAIFEALRQEGISEEKQEELNRQGEEIESKLLDILANGIEQNLGNPVGIQLLKDNYYVLDTKRLIDIVGKIPAQYAYDPVIKAIQESTAKMQLTAEGQKFTDFTLNDPNGNAVNLSDYAGKGKLVLIDFWASWCGPCRQEMPNVVKLYDKYKSKGLEIVGVSLDQDGDAWKKGIKDMGMKWPQMSDLKFWNCEAAQIYAVSAIPHTVLIDKDGTIIARGMRGSALYDLIAGLLD